MYADSCILSILIDGDMRIKITDFGSAKIIAKEEPVVDDNSRSRSFVGSADFVSPEVLRNEVATTAYVTIHFSQHCFFLLLMLTFFDVDADPTFGLLDAFSTSLSAGNLPSGAQPIT